MASAWGGQVNHGAYNYWYGGVNAWVESYTDTTAVIVVQARFQSRYAISSSQFYAYTSCGSQAGENQSTVNSPNSYYEATLREQRFTIARPEGTSGTNYWCVGRVRNTGSYTPGTSEAGVNVYVNPRVYRQPHQPKNFAAKRVSDAQMDLTWQGDYTGLNDYYPWTGIYVDRRVDDGEWSNIATLNWDAVNYSDRTTSPNHKYEYRVCSYGPGGISDHATAAALYTTPAAPKSVTLTKTTGTKVSVAANTSNAKYATAFDVQKSLNGGSWADVGSYSTFPQTVDVGGGTAKLRVRSKRGALVSGWTESSTITTIVAPNAPTITAKPASVIAVGSSAVISWTPNHPDGSAQTQAQIEYTVGSAAAQTATVQGSVTTYRLPSSATASAGTVKVRVRTHGLDPDWGAWTSYYSFAVAVPPEAHFTAPAIDGAKVGDLPLVAEWRITDSTGVASQSLQLMDESGKVLHSATPSTGTRQYTFDASTYQLSNATSYRLRLTVSGGSSLTVTTERTFATSFAEPARPDAGLSVDPSDLSAAVTVYAGSPSSETGEVIEVPATPGTLVPGFTVFGNTRQNLWSQVSKIQNGITITANSNGSVTVSGTSTSSNLIDFVQSYVLRPGSKYVLDVDKPFSTEDDAGGFYIQSKKADGSRATIAYPHGTTVWPAVFTVPVDAVSCYFGIQALNGKTVSGTYRVMLNEGSEPEPWCPPGLNGVDELSIVTAGKNLLARMGPSLPYTNAGITFSDNGDGGIRVSGTATAAAYYNFFSGSPARALRITPGEYTASLIGGASGLNLSVGYYDGVIGGSYTSWLATNVHGVSNTGSIDRPVYLRPFLSVAKGKTVDTVVYPQLELGSTATAYEPPNVTTTPIDLDGHTLNSLPDGTRDELRIDGTGAVTLVQRVGDVSVPSGTELTYMNGYIYRFNATINSGAGTTDYENGYSDKLPVRNNLGASPMGVIHSYNANIVSFYANKTIYSGSDTAKAAIQPVLPTRLLYELATPQEVKLPGIAMPSFPAAETQVFCASNVPCEVRVDYPDTDSLSVARVLADGSRWLVADGLLSGQQAIDPLPPLNVPYSYIVTARTEAGAVSQATVPARVDAMLTALNFGPAAGTFEALRLDPSRSKSIAIATELYDFADGGEGDGLPVAYSTSAVSATGEEAATTLDVGQYRRLEAIARTHPTCWVRDVHGGRAYCACSWRFSAGVPYRSISCSVSLTETRWREAW